MHEQKLIDELKAENLKLKNEISVMKNWVNEVHKISDCQECSGKGYVEVGPECSKPASSCCGGCYHNERCESCNGLGEETRSYYFDEESTIAALDYAVSGDYNQLQILVNNCEE
jgi:hypothetical protein